MVSAFADATFTFETDHAFSFETLDKVQIDGIVERLFWRKKKQQKNTTSGDLYEVMVEVTEFVTLSSERLSRCEAESETERKYSRTSMARTSLGPWKFVRDMGSSSHWGLILAPVQEANSDNLG